jgi:hypothetical protein
MDFPDSTSQSFNIVGTELFSSSKEGHGKAGIMVINFHTAKMKF